MFSARITLDPSACHDLVIRYLDGTRTHGILRLCGGGYFPAAIFCGGSPSSQRVVHAIVHIPLLPGEADALFADGQSFSIWADAIVSDVSVHGADLLGDGVILCRKSGSGQDVLQKAAHRPTPYRRASPSSQPGHAAPAIAGRR
jgi:hypothetical protein